MIKKILASFGWGFYLMVLLPGMAAAQRDWVFVGPRAVGMGSAYLAVSNNAEAVYWNPAALARMEYFHFTFGYGDFYKVNFKTYYASTVFNFPLGRRVADYFTFGLDWLGLQDSSQTRSSLTNEFHAALGIKPFKSVPTLSFGISANLQHQDDWNVGALYSLPFVPFKSWGRFSLGLMFHHRYGTPEKRPIGQKNLMKNHRFRYGLSYQLFKGLGPIRNPLLAIDYGERLHKGMELTLRLADWLTALIRYGVQKDLKNQEKMTHSFGITLNYDFRKTLAKASLNAVPQAEVAEVSGEQKQAEVCYHFARTNSPEWNSCYQYGVAAVIVSSQVPVPAAEPAAICPSYIRLNWRGSRENYEDGYVVLRDKVPTHQDYWFIKGLGWRENSYCDAGLNPGDYTYQIVAYKENIDSKIDQTLMISQATQISYTTTPVDWLCNLTILHHSKSITLTFGMAGTAANGMDAALCEEQLTTAQTNTFDARFIIPKMNTNAITKMQGESLVDIRPSTESQITWTIHLQPDQNQERFELTWDKSILPAKDKGTIQLKILSDVNTRIIKMQENTKEVIEKDEIVNQIEIIFTSITP
ncbi:MAG: hypothetical protein ONB16_10060 [candidate division KSB1 bacterium]|nr:hypothetical protein [candidate division KSB1 bacterium]MDZ7318018.1 hypothetical protein [candidate division KSB1 bacterium]MDZ7342713.1 hypothetical protein [candidate division KSB1 bacterium]